MTEERNLINEPLNKSDQIFYQAFQFQRRKMILSVCFQIVKIIPFVILIVIDIDDPSQLGYILLYFFNISCSVVGFLLHLLLLCKFNSVRTFLELSQKTNHIVQDQSLDDPSEIKNCVSRNTFDQQNGLLRQDLSNTGFKLVRQMTADILVSAMRQKYCWIFIMEGVYLFLCLYSFAFSFSAFLIILRDDQLATANRVILLSYVIVALLTFLWKVVLSIILSLLCFPCWLRAYIYCLCHKEKYVDLETKAATVTDMLNSEGNCEICHLSIGIGSKVYVLPCSNNHVFHRLCLKTWIRVQESTCPTCKDPVPQREEAGQNQLNEQNEEIKELQTYVI